MSSTNNNEENSINCSMFARRLGKAVKLLQSKCQPLTYSVTRSPIELLGIAKNMRTASLIFKKMSISDENLENENFAFLQRFCRQGKHRKVVAVAATVYFKHFQYFIFQFYFS